MFSMCNSCDGAYDSLDVRFTRKCDNACAFCIERQGIASLGETDVDAMIASAIASGIKSLLVLGGEPFLEIKKLYTFVKACRPHFDTIYITTSLPISILNEWVVADQILGMIDGLNVSFHSAWDEENNSVFQASSRHSRCDTLRFICLMGYQEKVRVCLNLVKGGIDTRNKLCEALARFYELGARHIKVNELQHSPTLHVSYEKIMGKRLPSAFSHGCSTYVDEWYPLNVLVKRSCFLTEPSYKARFGDLIKALYKRFFWKPKNRFAVLYENGDIATGWKTGGESC